MTLLNVTSLASSAPLPWDGSVHPNGVGYSDTAHVLCNILQTV